ncbi:unnamed protein product [Ectocarpus sp. CCAP 1310/34]|nr:unnamed protein product [Ectocarpus sp. CCAP 1310/34]
MRPSSFLISAGLLIGSAVDVLGGAGPVSVKVTLRGKKYDVQGATCVEDVQKSVEEQAGLAKEQQSVLFKGNLLKPELELEEAGVSDGDTVNIVPSKKPKTSVAAAEKAFAVGAGGDGEEVEAGVGGGAGGSDPFGGALGGLGGLGGAMGGGMPGGMPPGVTPEMYQKMMKEMMNSDMMEEVLGNPEKMEQARQAILDNPTLKQAMTQLPGFADMIDSPEKWRENMEMALEMFKAQKAMMQQEGAGDEIDGAADVDDLDDE